MDFFSLLILFFVIASTLQLLLQTCNGAMQRARQIAAIEKARGSRVMTMNHRQERRRFFGVPVLAARQIARALHAHPAKVTVHSIIDSRPHAALPTVGPTVALDWISAAHPRQAINLNSRTPEFGRIGKADTRRF